MIDISTFESLSKKKKENIMTVGSFQDFFWPYKKYTDVFESWIPETSQAETMAEQIALAGLSISNYLYGPGYTIWNTYSRFGVPSCQSCADWIYENVTGADAIIDEMNESAIAGEAELAPIDIDAEDIKKYDKYDYVSWKQDGVTYRYNVQEELDVINQYGEMLEQLIAFLADQDFESFDSLPATGSLKNCQGPVYDVAMAHR